MSATLPYTSVLLTKLGGSSYAGAIPQLNDDGLLDATLYGGSIIGGTSDYSGLPPIGDSDGKIDVSWLNATATPPSTDDDDFSGYVALLNDEGYLNPDLISGFGGGDTNQYLDLGGWRILFGTWTINASGNPTGSGEVTFPTVNGVAPFSSVFCVIPVATGDMDIGPRVHVTSPYGNSTSGFSVNVGVSEGPGDPAFSVNANIAYIAIGTPAVVASS